jgi:hypothetical protein
MMFYRSQIGILTLRVYLAIIHNVNAQLRREILNRLKSMGYVIETFFLYESDEQAFKYLNKLREFESLVKQKEGTLDISNDNIPDRQKQAISDSVKEFFPAIH